MKALGARFEFRFLRGLSSVFSTQTTIPQGVCVSVCVLWVLQWTGDPSRVESWVIPHQ